MAASVLHQVGLDDWAADSPGEYVAIARKWAADRAGLARLRADLRERVRRSPATNGRTFTKELEAALRQMWRDWVTNAE
jgi:predicted O-linked N-acetylglucosamine transferase (SPINDLY family)